VQGSGTFATKKGALHTILRPFWRTWEAARQKTKKAAGIDALRPYD